MRKVATVVVALMLSFIAAPADATATTTVWDRIRVERVFSRLGLPVGTVDQKWGEATRRATCMWRELTGRKPYRSLPASYELKPILATTSLTVPDYMVAGVNIDVTCQAATWVSKRLTNSSSGAIGGTNIGISTWTKYVKRVMQVSTGMPDVFPTRQGDFSITWKFNGWWQSTLYPDGKMYRPMFFAGGQALHGSISDDLVHTYPASHGCVRMLHADMDALWAGGFSHGSAVQVYGIWRG